MHKIAYAAFIAGVLAPGPARAAEPPKACSLLTAPEAGAAVGAAVKAGNEGSFTATDGPSKGQTFHMCSWDGGANGSVSVVVGAIAPGASRETFVAQLTDQPWAKQLKAQGWKQQITDVGDTVCMTVVPPAGQKNVPAELLRMSASTSCYAAARTLAVGVSLNGKPGVSAESVKPVLDKVRSRLP